MKARLTTSFYAVILTATAGTVAHAEDAETQLAWQEPGYVEEVVYATAPQWFTARQGTELTSTGSTASSVTGLAWQEPGYVEEVVVVTASRNEVLPAVRWRNRLNMARLYSLPENAAN